MSHVETSRGFPRLSPVTSRWVGCQRYVTYSDLFGSGVWPFLHNKNKVIGLNDLLNLYHSGFGVHLQSNEGLVQGISKIKLWYPETAFVELSPSVFCWKVKITSMTALRLVCQTGQTTKDTVKQLHRMCSYTNDWYIDCDTESQECRKIQLEYCRRTIDVYFHMTLSEPLIKGSRLKRVVSWNWFLLKGLKRRDVYSAFTVTLCWMKTGRGHVVTGNQPVITDNHKHTVHRSSRCCFQALTIGFENYKHTSSLNKKII